MQQRVSRQSGYTLIELSVVLIIVGILLAGALTVFAIYYEQSQKAETQQEITEIASKLEEFRVRQGRYPCPASFVTVNGEADHGRERSCQSTGNYNQACSNGVCLAIGEKRLEQINLPLSPEEKRKIKEKSKILIGAIPFTDLGLQKDYFSDGYETPYLYAVTADLAIKDPKTLDIGAIEIVDGENKRLSMSQGNAAFVILSFGPDKSGLAGGLLTPCSRVYSNQNVRLDTENCDMDATFRLADYSTTNDFYHFDDTIFYTFSHAQPNWQPLYNSTGDFFNKHRDVTTITIGHYKIASDLDKTKLLIKPDQDKKHDKEPAKGVDQKDYPIIDEDVDHPKLEIHGNLASDGKAKSGSLCDSSLEPCFHHKVIAGKNGMSCPKGKFMVGVAEGKPVCESRLDCPTGLFLKDLSGDISIDDCVHLPTACPKTEVKICGRTFLLPQVESFQTIIMKLGFSKKTTFKCEKNRWRKYIETGECECTPGEKKSRTACPDGHKGHILIKEERICTNGQAKIKQTILKNTCKCSSAEQTQTVACTQGYIGEITQTRRFQCPEAEWGPWKISQDNCVRNYDAQD